VVGKRTPDTASLNVGQAFGELGADDAALLGRVFVIRRGELRTDADDAAHEFDLLTALKPRLSTYRWRTTSGVLFLTVTVMTDMRSHG
jgi:hypothetical protein